MGREIMEHGAAGVKNTCSSVACVYPVDIQSPGMEKDKERLTDAVLLRLAPAHRLALEEAARREGLPLSAFIRAAALRAARAGLGG